MQRILLAMVVCLMTSQIVTINCYSVEPDEFLQNPKKELRARNISKNVRCLVCQNQSIDESSALLAKDLRILIRKKVKQGNSDDEIYDFLIERYGDFILLNPPFKISTLFLWILPFVFLAVGIFVIFLHNNKSKKLDYNK
jgi:cytochrome c-type biogenesis protein CcmH